MASTVDGQIVSQAQRGSVEAYDRLAREIATRLYPIAFRMLHDRDLVDDAIQRTLVTIWRELPKLRDPVKFEAWSYRLLVRFCLDELKKRQRLGARVVPEDVIPARSDDTGQVVDRDQLERALLRISTQHRMIVTLIYFRGLSGTEAAAALGISPGTVASRLHYALRGLRAAVEADNRPIPVSA